MSGTSHTTAPPGGPRWPARLVLGLALVLHLLLVLYFAPPQIIFGKQPVSNIDYTLHMYQVDRASKAFNGWGRLWAYDPQVLAGQPAGTLEDLTSKCMELFVIVLERVGIPTAMAFNLFILLVHLLVPLVALLSAWLLGLNPMQRSVAMLLWVLLWFFDSFIHWIWFCGMISWAAASCLAVLLVALVYRTVERGPTWAWVPAALLATLMTAIHPFSFVAAAPACAVIYLRKIRGISLWHHGGVLLTVALVLGVNSIWFSTALRFGHYLTDTSSFLIPSPLYVIWDYLDIMAEPWDQGGMAVRTLLRVMCLALTVVAFMRWRKQRDRRLLPLALMVGSLLVFTYVGGLFTVLAKTQPYRQITPLTLVTAFPAAIALVYLLAPRRLRRLGSHARILLIILLLLLVPRAVRTVLIFMPDPLPPPHKPVPDQGPRDPPREPLSGQISVRHEPLRHRGTPPGLIEIRNWLQLHHQGRGRVIVHGWVLGEYLAWSSEIPVLGGLMHRAVQHADAHFFRWHPEGDLPGSKLKEFLERYAVSHMVVGGKILGKLEYRRDLLHFKALVGGCRIYETKIKPSYFLKGQGRVASQSLNSIKVSGAAGEEVVLRFHWMETLRCRPGCRVERLSVPGDRVGFIRVPHPPPNFEIYNQY